jgi:hypothetical protein
MNYCDCDCKGCNAYHDRAAETGLIGRDDASGDTTPVTVVFQQKPKNARFLIGSAMAALEGGVTTEDDTNEALMILQGIYNALTEQHAERVG